MYKPFGRHQSEFQNQKCCVILPLAQQFIAIIQALYSQYNILYNRSHKEPYKSTLYSVYLSCAAITNGSCTVECHLQLDKNKVRTDTKRSPARAHVHGSLPVILGESQTLSKYTHNS